MNPDDGRRGNVAIEFGLSMPVLIFILLGLLQLGWTFYMYNGLRSSVLNGVRYASMTDYDPATTAMQDATKNVVVYGTPNPPVGSKSLVRGLSITNVNVSITEFAGSIPVEVEVSISGIDLGMIWPMVLSEKPQAAARYVGQYVGE